MAIDANALTLSEYAVQSNDPLVMKITFSLHKMANILQDIPLITKKTLVQNGVRFVDNLPTVNWGQINQAPTVTRGKPTPYQEQIWLVRNQFQVDKKLMEDTNAIQDPLDVQINAWNEAFTYDVNTKFIINAHDGTGDNQAPVGLKARIDNAVQYGVNAEMKIDGGGVDLSSSMTQATANQFIEQVQQMLDYMNAPDGDGVVFYCNDLLKRRWERAVRLLGAGAGFNTQKDAFDRTISMYKGAKIRDLGRKVDQTTRIIGDESATGAAYASGSKFTSLYACRYGQDTFCGWQFEPLKPNNLGLDPTNGVTYNTVIDWAFGLWMPHTRAICRQYDIKTA